MVSLKKANVSPFIIKKILNYPKFTFLTTGKKKSLKCLKINLQHFQAASATLHYTILELDQDVIVIQEPYVTCLHLVIVDLPSGFTI